MRINYVLFTLLLICLTGTSFIADSQDKSSVYHPGGPGSDPRPNLLIIHTDEHNFRTLGCYRDLMSDEQAYMWGKGVEVETPHIDRLAREGAIYTSYYASSPVCSPSRASMVSGLYPVATDVVVNGIPMNDNVLTFAEILSRQGYATSYVGKWHLDGEDKPGIEPGRKFGFSDNRYMMNRGHWKQAFEHDEEIEVVGAGQMDFENADPGSYFTDFLTTKTIEIIKRDKENPFCIMLSLPDPHGPNRVRPPYDSMFNDMFFKNPRTMGIPEDERPGWSFGKNQADKLDQRQMREYFGMVKCIDDNVGRLLEVLEDEGLAENTIVIFTADHGDLMGEHNKHNKSSPYEASAKIPYVISYPGKIPAGKVIHTAWTNVDFAPTILSLMKSDSLPGAHGVDGSSELLSETPVIGSDRIAYFTAAHGSWFAAANNRYKLILSTEDDPWLFDLERDPDELENFFTDPDYSEIAARFEVELLTRMHGYEDPALKGWTELIHVVEIAHPGKKEDFPLEEKLVQVLDPEGKVRFYFMDVKSVICGDNKCKIVGVRLYWDQFGKFIRYHLAPGAILEKGQEGLDFEVADLDKLNAILKIKDSPLSEYQYEELILDQHGSEFVDAAAGATIVIDEDSYIKGAIWTCYTLWHYVNGEAVALIRKLTGEEYSTQELAQLFGSGDEIRQVFALEQLMMREAFDPDVASEVLKNIRLDHWQVSSLLLQYLERTDAETYSNAMLYLLSLGSPELRIMCLNSVKQIRQELKEDFYYELCNGMSKLNSYQEISMRLEIVEAKSVSAQVVIDEAVSLLDHENILIARRAYWFLFDKDLDSIQGNKVRAFSSKHKDKL